MADTTGEGGRRAELLRIDCQTCTCQHTAVCADCVVTFLCDRDADDAVVVDEAELAALRGLARVGLAPRLRHRRRTA